MLVHPTNPGIIFHISSHFKKENKVQLMALVVPFTFGFDGSPFQTIDPSTNTHEQDVSEYGCLTKWKKERNKANHKIKKTELK